jgi:hypothetical protein
LIWRGAWNPATAYIASDAVSHAGSAYIATTPSTGEEPGTGASWDLLAAQGEQGPAGSGGGGGGFPETYLVANPRNNGTAITEDGSAVREQIAFCEAGDNVISGGYETYDRDSMRILTSEPYFGPDGVEGWRVVVDDTSRSWSTRALCADTSP